MSMHAEGSPHSVEEPQDMKNFENMPEPVPVLVLTWQDVYDQIRRHKTGGGMPTREEVITVFDHLKRRLPKSFLQEYWSDFDGAMSCEMPATYATTHEEESE